MGRYRILALYCAVLGFSVVLGQGTRRLRHSFSLFPVYRDGSNTPRFYILSTTDKYQVTGNLNIPFKGVSYPFSLDPFGMAEIVVSSSYVGRGTGASDTTFTVEANGDVVVYGYSQYSSSYQDSFYVIPLIDTGTEYYISSYTHYNSYGSYFTISSFFDDTDVTIYFSQQYTYSGGVYDRDNPLLIKLNAFRDFLFYGNFDFTGTFVNASKAFSVSCGHPQTSTYSGSVDALVEFPPPVKSWGSYFLVTKFREQSSYTLRILASQDNTSVTLETIGLNDTRTMTIQPGSFYQETQLPSSLLVFSSDPVMVVQYMATNNPSMTIVPPLDRAISGPLFLNSLERTYIDVTVWVSSPDHVNLLVDDELIQWDEILANISGWSVVQARLGADNHILKHVDPTVKIVGLAYYDGSSHPLMYFSHEDNDIDDQPPFIYGCPEEPVTAEIPPTEESVAVYWDPPTAIDNSGLEVTTVSNYNPGDLFPVGSTTVTYSSEDVSGNTATCQFEVFVADVSPPMISHCPQNIEIAACSNNAQISWEEPQADDESGHVITNSTHNPGYLFNTGDTHISYVFSDPSGNEAVCDFVVTIGAKECYSPPVIGLIVAIAIFSLAIVVLVIAIAYMIVKKVKS